MDRTLYEETAWKVSHHRLRPLFFWSTCVFAYENLVFCMASTGLPVLDKAERGELDMCGGLVEEPTPQIDERATHPPSGMEAQPQESVAQVQNEELGKGTPPSPSSGHCLDINSQHLLVEHVSGPIGLARVKDYDRRFAFYPSFSVERSIALEFRAEGISRLSMEIQHLRKELKPGAASKLSNPNPTDVAEEKMEVLLSRLAESVAQYGRFNADSLYHISNTHRTTDSRAQDAAWVNAKIIDNTGAPEDSSLQQLRLWLDQRSSGQVDMYRDKEWHEFRMLALEKGPIEKLVKAIMPLTRIGRIILVSISLSCQASISGRS